MAKRQDVKMVWTHGKKGSDDAFFVRASVFMVEQGFQVEFDDTDNISWHLAVYDGDEPIGAARIFLGEDKVWQIGRVCVLENYRGRKLGDKILEACEQKDCGAGKRPGACPPERAGARPRAFIKSTAIPSRGRNIWTNSARTSR